MASVVVPPCSFPISIAAAQHMYLIEFHGAILRIVETLPSLVPLLSLGGSSFHVSFHTGSVLQRLDDIEKSPMTISLFHCPSTHLPEDIQDSRFPPQPRSAPPSSLPPGSQASCWPHGPTPRRRPRPASRPGRGTPATAPMRGRGWRPTTLPTPAL